VLRSRESMIATIVCHLCNRCALYGSSSLEREMDAHSEIADYYVTCRFCNRQTGTKKYLQPLIDLLLDAGGPDPDMEYERSLNI